MRQANKYDKGNYRIISRVLGIETGTADFAGFIRRLVFSIFIGNRRHTWFGMAGSGGEMRVCNPYNISIGPPAILEFASAVVTHAGNLEHLS